MSVKKNRRNKFPDFQRYMSNEMDGNEKNSFERELQKDSFAEEAAEGLESVSADNLGRDLARLRKRIDSRVRNRKKFIAYRIAASVAVLMILSSVYLVFEKNRSSRQLTEYPASAQVFEIQRNEPVKKAVDKKETGHQKNFIPEKKPAATTSKRSVKTENITARTTAPKRAELEKAAEIPQQKITADELVSAEAIAIPMSAVSGKMTSVNKTIKGKVISAEDEQPLAGANVFLKGTSEGAVTDLNGNFSITVPDTGEHLLVANLIGMKSREFETKKDSGIKVELHPDITSLSEVVVTGYGTSKAANSPKGYNPPKPSSGISSFNNYLEENIHRPDTLPSLRRGVVVLSFTVHINGRIDNMKILRSPGKSFSDEAIRLIESGPAWEPGIEDGKPVEDVVTISIVFRKPSN
jgi:outer membrane biosynthesis protein TonB